MSERILKKVARTDGRTATDQVVEIEPVKTNEETEKLKADLDDLLDEIDEVLEVNAEEFVKSYVQKGGE